MFSAVQVLRSKCHPGAARPSNSLTGLRLLGPGAVARIVLRPALQLRAAGYTGLCPRVYQSGGKDHRGPLSKNGPEYLRWALIEAATHAARHPIYAERYRRTKTRLGRQRGPKIAQVDLARRLAEAIWHMLSTNRPFAPAGATSALAS